MTTNSPAPTWTIPPAQINSVAISDDGSRCVYGSSYERGQGYFYTYAIDNQGNQLWKQPIINNQATYQGVYWVDISGDASYIAAGGETVDYHENKHCAEPGFLQAFVTNTGEQFLNVTKPSRINQVSLSKDGKYLAVCYGKTVEVYVLKKTLVTPGLYQYSYDSIFVYTSDTYSMNNCEISHDGSMVVASGIAWPNGSDDITAKDADKTTATTGQVFSFAVNNGVVSQPNICTTSIGCMRVSITDNGKYWAASLHDGSCVLINQSSPTSKIWSYTPTPAAGFTLSLAYAVDITETPSGEVYVALGANLSGDAGILCLIKNTASLPALKWQQQLEFGVNPGVSMDHNATYVTAVDGKPDGQTTQESAGNLYMFKVSDGTSVIKQPTVMMNWPMQISRDASAVIGASDDGTAYFWQSPYS